MVLKTLREHKFEPPLPTIKIKGFFLRIFFIENDIIVRRGVGGYSPIYISSVHNHDK